jgi:hypothetical protein
VFDGDNMDLIGEMLRPISDGPFTEAPDLKQATDMVALQGIAPQKWIVS